MTLKLIEQVHELQVVAHVCGPCEGTGLVEYGGEKKWDVGTCSTCGGTGRVLAPDIDTLVDIIDVLAKAVVESKVCRLKCEDDWHEKDCPAICEQKAALFILTNGLSKE